jgi:signal transduction histidine kinase
MTVRTRLLLTLLAIALLLVVPAAYGLGRLRELRDITYELSGRHATAAVALGRLQASIADLDRFQRSYIAAPGPAARDAMWEALETARDQLGRLDQAGYDEELVSMADALEKLDTAAAHVQELVEAGQVMAATDYFRGVRRLLGSAQVALSPIALAIDERSTVAAARARRVSRTANGATILVLLMSVSLAVAVGLWLTTSITGPLHKLQRAMSRVAEGEFEVPPDLPYESGDEIGGLSRSFGAMTAQLAELNRLKAEFVSMASHELKTPINVIGGYAEMIEEGMYGELNDRQREALVAVREQVDTLTGQVNQLLDLSRFESGALQIEMDKVKLRDLFTSVRRAFDALARQKGVEFSVEVEETAPELITGDFDRLRNEVLGNVLGNAFKFTPGGGSIDIAAKGEGDRLLIIVRDTGGGIPAEDLPFIFEKYYQSGQRARAMGTGLGLAIAREIVEIHGGRIEAESEAGEGTTFRINLPIRQPRERPLRTVMRFQDDPPGPPPATDGASRAPAPEPRSPGGDSGSGSGAADTAASSPTQDTEHLQETPYVA